MKLNMAGVMRCCIATWEKAAGDGTLPETPGATIQCMYADDDPDHLLTLGSDGIWGWDSDWAAGK